MEEPASGRVLIMRSLFYLASVTKELFPNYTIYTTDGRLRIDFKTNCRVTHTVVIMHESKNERNVLLDWFRDLIKPWKKESVFVTVVMFSDKADEERYRNVLEGICVYFVREFVDDEENKEKVRDCLKKWDRNKVIDQRD